MKWRLCLVPKVRRLEGILAFRKYIVSIGDDSLATVTDKQYCDKRLFPAR